MRIQDRIVELRRVRASEIQEHPLNPRIHGDRQRWAVSLLMEQVGIADRLLVYVDKSGRLVLIDGHLRREVAGDQEVPVLVTDLTEEEAALMLAVGDPLAGLASTDHGAMAELLAGADSGLLEELLGPGGGGDPLRALLGDLSVGEVVTHPGLGGGGGGVGVGELGGALDGDGDWNEPGGARGIDGEGPGPGSGVGDVRGPSLAESEWAAAGMPEFEQEDLETGVYRLTVHFRTEEDVAEFERRIGQRVPRGGRVARGIWFPEEPRARLRDLGYRSSGSGGDG